MEAPHGSHAFRKREQGGVHRWRRWRGEEEGAGQGARGGAIMC